MEFAWGELVDDLYALLRLRTIPVGMKMFTAVEAMEAVPRIRRPASTHTTDQIVAQAARLGWTVGVTNDDLVGAQGASVFGIHPRHAAWAGHCMTDVQVKTDANACAHQHASNVYGTYKALAVSPLSAGKLDPPDVCLVYATPGQMMLLINGLQWAGYEKLEWSAVSESTCADSWERALRTNKPSLSIPCHAERRHGGVWDDELLMAIAPAHLKKAIEGMKQLSRNGLRYPIPPYGNQHDMRSEFSFSSLSVADEQHTEASQPDRTDH